LIKKFPSVWEKNVRKPQGDFLTHTVDNRLLVTETLGLGLCRYRLYRYTLSNTEDTASRKTYF